MVAWGVSGHEVVMKRKRCNGGEWGIGLGVGGWSAKIRSSRGIFGLLGSLEHLHDRFDPLHTETALRITNVQLGKEM